MAAVNVACPSCRAVLKLPETLPAGRAAKCPRCGQAVPLPAAPAAAAPLQTQTNLLGEGSRHEPTEGGAGSPVADPLTSFLAPAQRPDELGRLGPYRVLGILGQGGMGVVFKAEDPALRRAVALKVMLPQVASNPSAKARFLREARAQAAVEHDHVIAIHQVGEDRGVPFLAMPLLKGQTLSAPLKESRPPVSEVLRVGREMAEGLAAAHERGLVHRDIKPGNVWLEGARRRVKILDFGLARTTAPDADDGDDEPITRQGATIGTPAYMSPEQARGDDVDPRTDLFSLGVVMYQMATGELPFKGRDVMAILMALAVDTPVPPISKNPELPPALSDLILRLLAKSRDDRPATAEDVAEELRRIEESPSRAAPPATHTTALTSDPWADIDVTDGTEVVHLHARPTAGGSAVHSLPRRAGDVSSPSVAPKNRLKWGIAAAAGLCLALSAGAFLVLSGGKKPVPEADPPPVAVDLSKKGRPAVGPVPTGPVAAPAAPATIDLLASIDPARDAASGTWERVGNDLVGRGNGKQPNVLEIPYRPAEEYDFIVDFTRTVGNTGVALTLSHAGHSFEWTMAAAGTYYGFAAIDGRLIFDIPAASRPDLKMNNGQRYAARVEVRRDRVTGYLDGQKIAERKTDYANLSMPADGRLRDGTLLGLKTSSTSTAAFHRAEVIEVTGKGTFTRSDPTTPAPPSELEAARKAVAWVLQTGGKVWITKHGQEAAFPVSAVADLPDGFRFHEIRLGLQASPGLDEAAEAFRGVSPDRWNRHAQLMAHRPLTDEGLRRLVQVPTVLGVRQLGLNETRVTDAGLAYLRDLPRLASLSLNMTAVKGTGFVHLRGLTRLWSLNAPQCRLEPANLRALAEVHLHTLHLEECPTIDDSAVEPLSRVTSLRLLDVGNTALTADGAKRLAAALPGCGVKTSHGEFPTRPPLEVARSTLDWLVKVGVEVELDIDAKYSAYAPAAALPADARLSKLTVPATVALTNARDPNSSRVGEELAAGMKDFPASVWSGRRSQLVVGASVTPAGWKALAGVSGLRFIDLVRIGGAARDADLPYLAAFPHLERLFLNGAEGVTDGGLKSVAALPALREFEISNPGITAAGLAHLVDRPLTALSLRGTGKLGDDAVGPLSRMTALVSLECTKAGLTAEGVRKLVAALPGCRIVTDHGTFEPRPVPAPGPADDRKAADALHPYADLRLRLSDGKQPTVKPSDALPAGPFAVVHISFNVQGTKYPKGFVSEVLFPAVAGLRTLENLHDTYQDLRIKDEDLDQLSRLPVAATLPALGVRFKLTPRTLISLSRFGALTEVLCDGSEADDETLVQLPKTLPGLTRIGLSSLGKDATITRKGIAAITAPPVEFLSLVGSKKLDRETCRIIAGQPNLQSLFLWQTTLDDAGVEELARGKNLVNLNCGHTLLTNAGLKHLKVMISLRDINLFGTAVTDAGLEHLGGVAGLRRLNLTKAKVTGAGVMKLAAGIPKCKIDWDGGTIEPTER